MPSIATTAPTSRHDAQESSGGRRPGARRGGEPPGGWRLQVAGQGLELVARVRAAGTVEAQVAVGVPDLAVDVRRLDELDEPLALPVLDPEPPHGGESRPPTAC